MKKLQGKITISRVQSNADKYLPIRIYLQDEMSGCHVLEVSMELVDFAYAITGQGFQPCEVEYYDAPLGKKQEHKDEIILVDWDEYTKIGRDEKWAQKMIRAYEMDGWLGSTSDFFNHHHWGRITKDNKMSIRVGFVRYVDP